MLDVAVPEKSGGHHETLSGHLETQLGHLETQLGHLETVLGHIETASQGRPQLTVFIFLTYGHTVCYRCNRQCGNLLTNSLYFISIQYRRQDNS